MLRAKKTRTVITNVITRSKIMNDSQKRYAIKRLDDMLLTKKHDLIDKYTQIKKIRIDSEDMLYAIKVHDAELKENVTIGTSLKNAFDFTYLEQREVTDDKAVQKEMAVFIKKHEDACDEIMLGDECIARKLIREFSKE